MSNQPRRTGKPHGRRGGRQKRTTPEDVSTIFRYRGAGFSQDEIAEITGLSRQTVSYQLKKMRLTAIKGNIADVVRSQGLVDRDPEMLGEMESLRSHITQLELELDALISSIDHGLADNETGEPEIEPDTVVIDASNVLFQTITTESSDSEHPDIDVRASPNSLKSMIDYFEDEGRRVHCRMRKPTYQYLLRHAGLDDSSVKLIRSLVDSGKMELVRMEDDLQLFDDIRGTIISNDETIQGGSRVLPYYWAGSELVITGLPESDQKTDAEHVEEDEHDGQTIAREVVFSMLSDGEYIPVQNIQFKLASTFLGLEGYPASWEKGWPAQLKEELNLSGKGYSDQLSRLMENRIEFDDNRNWVRKISGRRTPNDDRSDSMNPNSHRYNP